MGRCEWILGFFELVVPFPSLISHARKILIRELNPPAKGVTTPIHQLDSD
jgi:hypothetical protein